MKGIRKVTSTSWMFFPLFILLFSSYLYAGCEDLVNLKLTDETFNKEITISSATLKEATQTLPSHCEVKGIIWPEINFLVKLPAVNWNERFYMTASGAAAGLIPEAAMNNALAKGFAVAGTDTGHKGASSLDWTWAHPDATNRDQKIKDYFYRANHEVALVAKSLIRAYYGIPPKYSYWEGCSGAGRAGMTIAQRYPTDFNGYVIGAANRDYVVAILDMLWLVRQGTKISNAKIPLIGKYVYEKCDALDGLKDGLIEDPRACKFDPMVDLPACQNDADGPACFTTAERTAIKNIYAGCPCGKMPMPPGSEVCTDPTNPSTSGWQIYIYAPSMMYEGFMKYMLYADPNYDVSSFDFEKDVASAMATEIASLGNLGQKTDLSGVKNNGGKIIEYIGWSDNSPYGIINYYESVKRQMGGKIDDFYKLFLVPGMFHCGGGIGCSRIDWLTPLMNWVEKGIEPKVIIGSRSATSYLSARTRPICAYPKVARYVGSGDIDKAENFVCVDPTYVESKTEGVAITQYAVRDKLDIAVPHPDFQFDRIVEYTATLPVSAKEATISIDLGTVPSNPHIYKIIGSTWKLIYPSLELKGIKNVSLTGSTLTYTIEDNSDADEDSTPLKISDPIVIGSYPGAEKGGGCFIATVAFGSYLHPYVQALRDFRDKILLKNRAGQKFVEAYYRFSPPVADFLRHHENLKSVVRLFLIPLVGMSLLSLKLGFTFSLGILIGGVFAFFCGLKRWVSRGITSLDPEKNNTIENGPVAWYKFFERWKKG